MVEFSEEVVVQTTKTVRLINVRSSDRKAREAIRKKACELFQKGARPCAVSRELGVQTVTVCRWFKAFQNGGKALLEGERRRWPAQDGRTLLTKFQMEELRNALEKRPLDYLLPYRRWSFAAVAELVKAKFGLDVSRVTAGKWLAQCRLGKQVQTS